MDSLVVTHSQWIREKARAYCANETEAKDLASETIFRCLQNADKFDKRRPFKPWAQTLMVNILKNSIAKKKRLEFRTPFMPQQVSERIDEDILLSDLLTFSRRYSRMTVNMESVLLYAKGYSYKEISDKLGVCKGTVKSRIANGRKMIMELFNE